MTDQQRAEARTDFVKRLFAVSISVGFAAQLNRILSGSITNGELLIGPLWQQHWKELLLLVTSMVAVVGSWEGYLASIARRPRSDLLRFYLDVGIVFAYLVLMLCCQLYSFWFIVLMAIFGLYAVWDILPSQSDVGDAATHEPIYKRSITITVIWSLLFVAIAGLEPIKTTTGFALTAIAALLGLVFYRIDKDKRAGFIGKGALLALPVLLLGAAWLVGR